MSSACSSLRIRFSIRCLTTGYTGVSATRRTQFLKSFFSSRVSMWKVLEKMTIVSKKFDIYMVSRFDWSISILFFIGGYVCFDRCESRKVSHRVESMYFFILNFLFFKFLLHPSVLSHRTLGTAECDESYCIEEGNHIWSSGCGEFFYHESYCDESVIMTIYEFQIFCDVSSGGWRRVLLWHMGGVYPYMGPSIPPQVFGVPKKPHTLLLFYSTKCYY